MTNYEYGGASPTLAITARDSPAIVKVEVTSLGYSEKVNIAQGETKWIALPAKAELENDVVSRKTVSISSDADISVVSSNIKEYTGDTSVIFPVNQLGRSYVVFTPDTGPLQYKKQVVIANGKEVNTVNIVYLSPRIRPKTITLNAYEVIQLQSFETLSGTKITSTFPVAVLAGHQCAQIVGTCEHVYEQLIPTESLSNTYLVPAMHLSYSIDTAYVVAPEDNTVVSIFSRNPKHPQKVTMNSGDVYPVHFESNAKVIKSDKNIMVMYMSSNYPYDEFLVNLLPTSEMSKSWTIYPQVSYENTAVIVAEAASAPFITKSLKWKVFPGDRKYVWAIMPVGSQKGPITISGDSPMAVYVYGGKVRCGYASTGVCNTVSVSIPVPPPDPCETMKCREREECRKGVCVPTSFATCHAVGDPHFKTFDGKLFDFQGTCTYIMVNNTKPQKGLIPFTILTKNNHRGNNRVAYVRMVSVLVYNHTVVASSKRGLVEFDGENTYLPFTFDGGKIKVEQRGWDVIISTDFGLQVKYDWNMMLFITVPSNYFQTVGGLCGNYNGDRRDEFADPKGTAVTSVLEFAKSWKVPDKDLFCNDDCNGQCPTCSLSLQEQYRQESNCGVMAKKDGPFANCHALVDPNIYVDNCVYDVCINNGARIFICNNIQSYVGACMSVGVKITGNWRTISNCPLDCPANSHYESCGTACPASCVDREASSKCTLACVEGCQCNEGYVRSGDECIPVKKCGCTYKDRYYPAEQSFWGDKKCTEKCVCNPQTGGVECKVTNCKKSEICDTRNGVRDCYPLSYGTCQGIGDPHYRTFDGKAFDFQGTCTYYLSKLLNTADPSLIPFEVLVKNENRGSNKAVSYTKTVSISVYGYTIVLSKDNPKLVKVNDLFVNLPYEKDGRLYIYSSGIFGVVNTNFGLTLKFNWKSHVVLNLPSTYSNVVGGLCGNWNGNSNDDLRTPDDTLAANPTLFGTSWKIKDDPGCSDECKGKVCPKCDATERYKVTYTRPCSIIQDKSGPFRGCHEKVNPTQFYEDCVYDMCMFGGHSSALCSFLTAYTAACQNALGKVESWRTDTLCPASCKANSHYDVCGAGCPQTCVGLTEPKGCMETLCVEGCTCDDGFILSNGECVSIVQCGCTYMGLYYQLGQEFFPEGKCKQKCVCKENGKVQCEDAFTCRPGETCKVQNGVQGCFPEGKAVCTVSGYGLYQSFDGKSFSVEGNCEYRLVEMTQKKDEKTSSFSVLVKQQSSSEEAVLTRRVKIQINQYTFTLLPGRIWEIQVNNAKMNLPVTVDDGLVQLYQSGLYIVVETYFGLKLTYDTVSMVTVEIPSTFKSAVTGLCGNYNENKEDDFLLPGGIATSSVEIFAEAWVSPSDRMLCQTGCGSKCVNPDKDKQTQAETSCSILTSEKGPFSNCYDKVPPQKFFDECVKDVAAQSIDTTVLCRHIQRYVASCQETGTSINSWRTNTFCPFKCFINSHYELCADTCTSTCASLTKSEKCPPCHEGCQCDDGFVFDGGECKTLKDCGCQLNGVYYKTGEVVVLDDCESKCQCNAGVFSCEPMDCAEDQICGTKDGTVGCYKTETYCPANSKYDPCATACPATCVDRGAPNNCTLPCVEGCPCNEGYVLGGDKCLPETTCGCTYQGRYYTGEQAFWGDKCTEKCVCNRKTGKAECTPAKCQSSEVCDTRKGVRDCYPLTYGTCQGIGDPHYRTFDGKAFNFQGTCTYYLSKLLNTADPLLIPFEVLVKNENRGSNKAVAYTKTVSISVYGYTIVLSKDNPKKVKVNDLFVNLPYEKDGRLYIYRSGFFGVVKADFGLTLQFNWDSHVVLTLPSTYSNKLGGLCGNWNGNSNDDLRTPNDTLAANPTLFGTSWKVRDDPGCSDECKGKVCPQCDVTERNTLTFTKPCSIITDKMGPFKGCHEKVNPTQFYEDCVYDMCMYGGHSSALCSFLTAYTAACQNALGKVESWRTDILCPASCKANSHYNVCGAGCPQNCVGLTGPKGCTETLCVEGCTCDSGFILSNGECVSNVQCGCTYMGLYYQLGQEFFPEGKCKQKCVCKENGKVQCEDAFTCRPGETCKVQNGVQGCFPEGKAMCTVSGYGLYQSFDGKSFSVEGNCEYKLVEMTQKKDEKTSSLSVLVKQQSSSEEAVLTRSVKIQINQYTFTLLPGRIWETQVNNSKMNLPVTVEEGLVQVYQSGLYIVVETSFGLKLTYDTVSMVTVEIPSTFKSAVTGLCGNYNENKEDDFLLPGGIPTSSVENFAEAWVSPSDRMLCQTGCGSKCVNPDKDKQTQAETSCSILTSENGPFSNCYDKVPPQKFFDECVKDVAAQSKDNTVLCSHIQRYVASCQETGTSINSWRNNTFCPFKCFMNSHYELCADTCTSTCNSLTKSEKCPPCHEGCQCDDGFVFDGGECKTLKDCGCQLNGVYYKTGEVVVLADCKAKCQCNAGVFSCEPLKCGENQICGTKDGTVGCYKTETYCPANSTYNSCGTACPAICVDQDAPNKCTLPCVNGCQCNKGYVFNVDKCLPETTCGCTYQGQYYTGEQTFWGDTKCTEKCVCNRKTGKAECTPAKCQNSEMCDTRNGVRDCYPLTYGICQGIGDPHYRTFDGKAFNFQGTCTYYLSKLLNTADPSLIPFEVLVKNENRGSNKAVAYTKTVSISVYGYTIVLSKDNPKKVKVNDLFVNLPYEKDGRLYIYRSGFFGVVKADFGLTLQFNWDSHVVLTLPSTYSNKLGGLCGNWNGNSNDDLRTPNDTLAANPTLFGTSWKFKDDPGCSDECKGKVCPQCDATERNTVTFTKPCSIITDKMGPFKGCHEKVNPTQFYEDCVYDMCMYGGHSSALCSFLTAYTAACQNALGKVESWRTNTLCPASCKANSHYNVCGAGCPQNCVGLTGPKGCTETLCVEGCTCDGGFILSNGECVSNVQCGCTYMGQYYQLGQEFFPEGKCKQKCVCTENGKVQCKDAFTCSPGETCKVQNGVQGCFPEGKAVCTVSGYGLYQSFDGKSFNVEGNCEYKLVEMTQKKDEKTSSFSVLVKQQSSSEEAVLTRSVKIQINQHMFTLLPGQIWETQVNNVKMNLPLTVDEGLVQVYQSGLYIVVETSFGLKLTYDTVSMVTVEIPSTFKSAVTGLCGNYNENKADDFLLPDGNPTSSEVYFVEAWVSPSDKMMCQTGCGTKCVNPDKDKQTEAETSCSILTSENGPFSNCYDKVPPQKFFDECVKDVAAQSKDNTVLCSHIQKYVASCQETGTSINSWRNNTFCPFKCFVNSHYELCADTCTSTCASLTKSEKCPQCHEGCQCDDGLVFDGGECKALKDCGCDEDGRYYKSDEEVIEGDCERKCLCKAGVFSCEPLKCALDQFCGEKDGVFGCHNKDLCSDHKCREKEHCTVNDNKALCVPVSKASCMATGDPHYRTFDGNHFSFQGICSYTLVKTSGKDKTLTPFSIVNKNEMRKGSYGSYIKSASIKVKGHDITFIQGNVNHVTIDGNVLNIPVSLSSEGINIMLSGTKGILNTDFGLEVIFNWADTLMVVVSSSYYNNIEGMCGTYNDDLGEDFVTPSGNIMTDITEWAASWSVPESSSNCWHFPPCSEENKLKYRGQSFCGLLEDANGPFSQCQNIIAKRQFASDCLFQLCLQGGSQTAFCNALSNYESTCALAQADVSPKWKQLANC
ncbi:IgGFc-binding protein [Misgurnus anguillicaudatus]|uniref:IgGFc-binding protein n=1 Tax=Misgurnus anguillicaudatus TaxID=75329 RepID=UPI003CCFB839